jgi:hypothetical protein
MTDARMNSQVSIVLVSVLVLLSLIPLVSATSTAVTVPLNGAQTVTVELKHGDYVSGTMTASGAVPSINGNKVNFGTFINFEVSDPNQNTLVSDEGVGRTSFSFLAPATGAYSFYFYDESSSTSKVTVTLDYSVVSSETIFVDIAVVVAVIIVLALVIVGVAVWARRRKRSNAIKSVAKKDWNEYVKENPLNLSGGSQQMQPRPFSGDQEELIAKTVKQSIMRLVPEGGVECKLIYCMPLEALSKNELENLRGKLKDSYDKKSFLSKTQIVSLVPQAVNYGSGDFIIHTIAGDRPDLIIEKPVIEIIHIANDLWVTSFDFTYDDMAVYIGHQLKDYFNLTVKLCNPEKTFT